MDPYIPEQSSGPVQLNQDSQQPIQYPQQEIPPQEKNISKLVIVIISVVALVIIAGVAFAGAYIFIGKRTRPTPRQVVSTTSQRPKETPVPQANLPLAEKTEMKNNDALLVLQNFQAELNGNAPIIQNLPVELNKGTPIKPFNGGPGQWYNSEGILIDVTGGYLFDFPSEKPKDVFWKNTDFPLRAIDGAFIETFSDQVQLWFQGQGFSISQANLNRSGNAPMIDAYEKGNVRCSILYRVWYIPYAWISCFSYYDVEKLTIDKEILNDIYPNRNTTHLVNVSRSNEKYALGYITRNHVIEGVDRPNTWLAYKQGGVWQLVYDGPSDSSCSIVDTYQFPKDIYRNCIEESTGGSRFQELL